MYASFDLETTGTNFILDEICELAIVVYNKDFKIEKEFRSLLKTHKPIPEDVILIHGITNEMVEDKPYFEDIATNVLELLKGQVLCGQNIKNFDIPFIAEKFFQLDVVFNPNDYRILDSLQIETIVRPRTLGFMYKTYLGVELEDAHSALADSKAAMEVILAQIKTHNIDLESEDFNKALGIHDKYVDPTRKLIYIDGAVCWAIGKHKGKTVASEKSYAEWAMTSDFPKSTKFFIKQELDKIDKAK